MEQNAVFQYQYSASQNDEVQKIRKKYLPKEESKLEELKRLDRTVQNSGMTAALCVGIIGALVFGTGMCHAMQVLGNGVVVRVVGIVLSLVGVAGMLAAYPLYRKLHTNMKAKLTPRILDLVHQIDACDPTLKNFN